MATLPRFFTITFAAGALAALAGMRRRPGGAGSGPPAEAPAYRVGDRWAYHGDDGFRVKTEWDETHEVVAIGPEGITVRVTLKGATTDVTRTELWSAPGQVKVGAVYDNTTRRFAVPLERYDFPLARGQGLEPVGRQLQRVHEGDRSDQPLGARRRAGRRSRHRRGPSTRSRCR